MGIPVYENLKGFVHSRPPLMVFVVCIGLFAVVLMSLAYYVQVTEEIRDPDITRDWNIFLDSFSALDFCIQMNNTDTPLANATTTVSPVSSTIKAHETNLHTTDVTSPAYDTLKNYSVSMLLKVTPTRDFLHIPHNLTHLSATIYGEDIGLQGAVGKEPINVTMDLPYEWNTTKCCKQIQILACVYFQAAPSVFPNGNTPDVCESMNDTGVEYHARMLAQRPQARPYSSYFCQQRPVVNVNYKLNKRLTVLLSLKDRSVINLHLMHTSYFLFVMVVTILCYAIFRGRPIKSKVTQTDTESLMSSTDA